MPESFRRSSIPARARNSVCVTPGQKTVTVTPVPFSSFCREDENDSRNALHALYTDWNGTGENEYTDATLRIRPLRRRIISGRTALVNFRAAVSWTLTS